MFHYHDSVPSLHKRHGFFKQSVATSACQAYGNTSTFPRKIPIYSYALWTQLKAISGSG